MTLRLLYSVVCGIILLTTPALALAQNAGIVRGLWFSTEEFFVGDTVRVYVAVRNNTGADLSGTVEFFVDGERIERNTINALDGRIVESWADWKPRYGTSTVLATLSRTELSSTASGTAAVTVTSSLAEEIIFVDKDTDGNGVGNQEDPDDDGDGILDGDDPEPERFNQVASASETPEPTSEVPTEEIASETQPSDEPVGLEQFLTPSRADTTLERITETINTTKRRLDEYRSVRTTPPVNNAAVPPTDTEASTNSPATSTATTTETAVADGFGEVTRSVSETPKTSWLAGVIAFIGSTLNYLYTGVLALLSFILGYPGLIQLALLLLIVFGVIKTAARLARRP